jgi:serine-threonine kinase receptor-associated protein
LRAGVPVASLATGGVTTSLEVAPDGRTFVTAAGRAAAIWDARSLGTGPASSFPFNFTVESASLAPTQGRLAVGGEDMWVHVLDAASGTEIDVCKGHHGPVHTVRFAPGGGAYASGSEDGTIRIWETEPAAAAAPGTAAAAAAGGEAEPVAIAAA